MTDVEFRSCGPSIEESDVAALEAILKARLPEPYRHFLLSKNGGKPTPHMFLDTSVRFFYSLCSTEKALDLGDKISLFEWRMPEGAIPIARDPFGNQVILFVQGAKSGEVCFWDHENDSVRRLARTFDEFIELLFDEPRSRPLRPEGR